MTLAIKTFAGDFIYFDAVLSYKSDYQNRVTKHPVDGGGVISDHYIDENPSFSFTGVITEADLNPLQLDTSSLGSVSVKNNTTQVDSVNVKDQGESRIFSLDDVLGKSISSNPPRISYDLSQDDNESIVKEIKSILISIRDSSKNKNSNKSLFTLYEIDGDTLTNAFDNCVICNLSFNEDPDTGSALNVSISAEVLKFVELVKTTVSKNVHTSIKDKASPVSNKGTETPEYIKRPPEAVKDYNQTVYGSGK